MPVKPLPPKEFFVDLHFPLAGMDMTYGLDRQPSRSTAGGFYARTSLAATNVLGLDSIAFRYRGGSRPGLTPRADQLSGPVTLVTVVVYTEGGVGPQA